MAGPFANASSSARRLALAGAALAASACALDWNFSDASPVDGGVDATHGLDASLDATADVTTGDDTGVDAGGGADGADATAPGCHANGDCKGGQFCHFPDHRCGQGAAGVCLTTPTGCPPSAPYACTCTRAVDYSGACAAESKGNDVSILGCSMPPPGAPCGYLYCVTACTEAGVDGEAVYSCP